MKESAFAGQPGTQRALPRGLASSVLCFPSHPWFPTRCFPSLAPRPTHACQLAFPFGDPRWVQMGLTAGWNCSLLGLEGNRAGKMHGEGRPRGLISLIFNGMRRSARISRVPTSRKARNTFQCLVGVGAVMGYFRLMPTKSSPSLKHPSFQLSQNGYSPKH